MKRQFLRQDIAGGYPISLSEKAGIYSVSFKLPAIGGDRRDYDTREEAEEFYEEMLALMKGEGR